jgi:hypothetical protein
VEQVKGELDKPTDTLRRILHGAIVDGKHDMLADVVISYTCLIQLYQRATQSKPALAGEKACACGCGAQVAGRKKWATPWVSKEGVKGVRDTSKSGSLGHAKSIS